MWPWDISQLPPEDRAELRLQAMETRKILRASYMKIAVVVYAAIVILMYSVVQTAHDPTLRTLIMFAIIAAGVGIFFRNPFKDRFDSRGSTIQDQIIRGEYRLPQNAGSENAFAGTTGAANESPSLPASGIAPVPSEFGAAATGAVRQVHSLSELPPELAAIPDVQKIFESAGSRGVWMSGEFPHAHIIGPTKTVIRISTRSAGHQPTSATIDTEQLPPELRANPDPLMVAEWVRSHGLMHPDAVDPETPAAPIPTMPIQDTNSILTRLAAIAICVAIAMGTAAMWMTSFSRGHH